MNKKKSIISTRKNAETTFICESCNKIQEFTPEEIKKKRKTDPDLFIQGFDYYISCPFCTNGHMLSQLDLVFHQMAADLFGQ